jgi:hypothetical protein
MSWDMYGYLTGPKQLLFKGMYENRSEYVFYSQYKSNFLLPTYFSFFGLFNIQKIGKKFEFKNEKEKYLSFWRQMLNVTSREATKDGHHFSNPKNFCEENGKLKIMDYGSPYTQEVLEKYGEKIYKEFDLGKC